MNWTKLSVAMTLAAAIIVSPTTAYADCGDPDQPACTGPVPTVDQVTAIMDRLTDPNIPSAEKGDIVTPPFDADQAQRFDSGLDYLRGSGVLPFNFTVTDIQPAPNNMAGATVSNPPAWHERHGGIGPVVLQYQDGRWTITNHTAFTRLHRLIEDRTIHVGGI